MFGMEADRFTGRKILVAGALSALGPPLIHQLIRAGAEVLATDQNPASLARLSAWLDGAVQVRALGPDEIPLWIRSDHPDLAGLILADPRAGAANLALARRLLPQLARNPSPFVAALAFAGNRPDHAAPQQVPLTLGILPAPPSTATTARLAARFLDAVRAGRPEVRLGGLGLPRLLRPTPAPLAKSPETC